MKEATQQVFNDFLERSLEARGASDYVHQRIYVRGIAATAPCSHTFKVLSAACSAVVRYILYTIYII